MKAQKRTLYISLLLLLVLLPAGIVLAAAEPVAGSATVDGDPGEWTQADFFAPMYFKPSQADRVQWGSLYLRYDCEAEGGPTLYALVTAEDPHYINTTISGEDHFIKFGNSTLLVDGTQQPDNFQFVNNVNGEADGYEAKALVAPGTYPDLNVHTDMDQGVETVATENRGIPITLGCGPSAVSLGTASAGTAGNGFTIAVAAVGFLMVATTAVVVRRRD